jgi:hypothetical protein
MSRAQSGVRVVGDKEAQAYLTRLAESGRAAEKALVQVGSPLAYAYGIETGRHRGGRLARRAGGVFYLQRAADSVQQSLKKVIAHALPDGADATLEALKKVGFDVERHAKALVPRVTGTLQRSIQTIYPGRGVAGGGIAVGIRSHARPSRRPR